MAQPGTTFANHRGVVPMLSVLLSLSVLELTAVHLLVALRWPVVGWTLTALSAATIVWLVLWIRSWKRLPHRLEDGVLTLYMGSLKSVALPVADIRHISPCVTGEILKAKDCANLVPIAFPNRIVEVATPQGRRGTRRYAIRLDDPAAFDAAMAEAGILPEPRH